MPTSNERYIQGLYEGDNQVIEEIYALNFYNIRNYILSKGGEEQDAKDIFNEAMKILIKRARLETLRLEKPLKNFLFGVCKTLWLKKITKQNKERVTLDDYAALQSKESPDAQQLIIETERWALFREKLYSNDLGDNCRTILILHFEKKSAKEIMETLGYNNAAVVRQRIFKCKNRISKLIRTDPRFIELANGVIN